MTKITLEFKKKFINYNNSTTLIKIDNIPYETHLKKDIKLEKGIHELKYKKNLITLRRKIKVEDEAFTISLHSHFLLFNILFIILVLPFLLFSLTTTLLVVQIVFISLLFHYYFIMGNIYEFVVIR